MVEDSWSSEFCFSLSRILQFICFIFPYGFKGNLNGGVYMRYAHFDDRDLIVMLLLSDSFSACASLIVYFVYPSRKSLIMCLAHG